MSTVSHSEAPCPRTCVTVRITCTSNEENLKHPCLLLHTCYFFLAIPLKSKIKCSFSKTAIFVFQTLSQPQHPCRPHHHYSRALNSNLSTHCPTWRRPQSVCHSLGVTLCPAVGGQAVFLDGRTDHSRPAVMVGLLRQQWASTTLLRGQHLWCMATLNMTPYNRNHPLPPPPNQGIPPPLPDSPCLSAI